MICVIDYGAGNLHSVLNALHYLDAEATVIAEAQQLATADAVILPGVGSFGDAMQKLRAAGLDKPFGNISNQTVLFLASV